MEAGSAPQPGRARGLLYGLLASALWGGVFPCGRYLVDLRHLDPLLVGSLRFGIGAAAAAAFLWLRGGGPELRRATREGPLLAALGAVGIFGMGCLVFFSVRYTASINCTVILNANPVFIALFAPLVGERVPALRVVGLLLGLAGCATIGLGDLAGLLAGSNDLLGCSLAAGGACCWAAYTVFGKGVAQRRGGLAAATLSLVAGALLYLPLLATRGPLPRLTAAEVAVALFLGLGPTATAMLLWYRAVELVDANVLGPTQYVATLIGTLLGWGLLGERMGPAFVAGGAAILVGLALAVRGSAAAGSRPPAEKCP